jgi:hypothetical protein
MKFFLLAVVGATSLSGCSNSNTKVSKDVLMHNDFESLAGWVPDAVTRKQEQAHSGHYSIKADQTHPYSLTYYSLLGQLSPTRISGVRVDAWAYMSSKDINASLRVGVNDVVGGKMVMGDGIDYNNEVQVPAKWVKISKDFAFPPTVNYSSQLVIYLWGPGGNGTAYIDDIQLTALH